MLKKKGYQVQFLWVPAHEGILGNELAHQAALEATVEGRTIDITYKDPKRLRSAAMRNERQFIRQERIQAFQNDLYGHFTRKLDQALPQRHTLKLYNKLSIIDASILIQLRSGHAKLNKYLHRIKKANSAQCRYSYLEESIRHFVIEYSTWANQRKAIHRVVKERFTDLSYLLGG